MKFVISLFISFSACASPIHLFYEGDQENALIYKEIMMKDYLIPEELIKVREALICEKLKPVGKLDVCLKSNGDLYLVSVDRDFVNESLKVFRAP